ncbi:DUF3857 domain-containing protein [Subsaximicrobium wynnwilliamsii]|uniref:DUF3857 domain-containing protein n=1 Tax=Subsaximicrobium wynnwilliamsii TaxID=291179 RepID=A0A5C6ZGI1_9FLAO|nr:DUF3857 domain-containing protein [Subsaximicrobium wynnwilliamsii]TXD83035.1 DUF3857 domain-containing protein [Subsaximicrobium wynnwilliamsii]TXD88779.1 DUF3857 domain-containing protein [Subsaximicrobium wynnwilliamsii]TXE02852.1 DUF3857 domain-containing protein [Subsaximicrobium wynnwilliamsii]
MTKKLLALLLLFQSLSVLSQSKEALEAKNFFWGEADKSRTVSDIPANLQNESAVILYKNENYDFHKYGKNVTYTSSIRKRIKLLDQAAVDEFSEFSFQERFYSSKGQFNWFRKGSTTVGIKIIKPDGSETEIDVEAEAIEVDGENKLAIANLEVGDIIDYYYFTKEPFKSTYAFGFEPVEKPLAEEYPILEYKLFFETENDFFINFNSYNGAPKLSEIPTEKRNMRRYELTEINIPKGDFTRWFYPLVELPSYKFQVYFARSGKFEDLALAFLPKNEATIKTSVSQQEVLELYENRFRPDGDLGDVKDYFKGKTFEDDAHKVTAAYYYMRHYYLTRFMEAFYAKDANISPYPFMVYGNNVVFIQSQKQFIRHFTEYLRRQKIAYEIVVAKNRFDGTLDDLLIENNIEILVKINTEKPLYASFFGPHTNINEFSPLLEGTEVYLLSASRYRIDQINKGKLPSSTYADNETKKNITLSLNEAMDGFKLTAVNSYKGHEKSDQQYDRFLYTDYVSEDYKKYETETWVDMVRREKDQEKYQKELDALTEKLRSTQKERFEDSAKAEYFADALEDYTYQINANGRYSLDSYFIFTEGFTTKNTLIKKAGPNHIIEIGKLIGGQIDLTKKERERSENIYLPYPRSYNYQINMKIPDGYSVSGLEKLNTSVDNATGAFISTAKIEDGVLIINTFKRYKNYFEPNSNWEQMIAFLDAANQFTNEKILLKKE